VFIQWDDATLLEMVPRFWYLFINTVPGVIKMLGDSLH